MPEKWSHFTRMYLRWMRGSTIRSVWRMRYLSPARPAYWLHAMRWLQMVLTQMVVLWLVLVEPLLYGQMPPGSMLVIPFLIGYAQGLRYLSIIRSDERIRSRALTWLTMPLAIVLAWTVLRFLRWYGIFTCARTGWGTRQNGAEVTLGGQSSPPPPEAAAQSTYVRAVDPWDESTLEIRQYRAHTQAPWQRLSRPAPSCSTSSHDATRAPRPPHTAGLRRIVSL
ncbi:hypothetical protein [Streptomyces xantholiticus]|uniref:hypothetical protein n=1 Tax=Streptomyces xantholiticus TaxID=68285 RepID=UPI0019C3DCA6|nr:hypothetical protein [Streptomyces xantholiticus]GGW65512.1 hypothetical protein GCM10010381_58230 [Streptomyces xantholiticus]